MPKRLSLFDFRDLDLMMKLDEVAGASGCTTRELAEALGFKEEEIQSVAIRSSWMRRYGIFDFDKSRGLWTLAPGGERVVRAKMKAASAKSLDAVPDESMVDVMAHVTSRFRFADPVVATMLRREFMFGTSPKSSVWEGR